MATPLVITTEAAQTGNESAEEMQTLRRKVSELESLAAKYKAAQQEIQVLEKRYRGVIDNIPDGLIIFEHGQSVYVNDRACDIFGYPRNELEHLSGSDLAAPEERARISAIIEKTRIAGTSPSDIQCWILRKDGTRRFIQATYSLTVQAGQVTGHFVLIKDITAEKRNTQKLEETRDYLDNIIGSSLDGIVVTDGEGHVTMANKSFLRMVGYDEREALGLHVQSFFVRECDTYECTTGKSVGITPEYFTATDERSRQLFENGNVVNWDAFLIRKDRLLLPTEQNVVFLFNKENQRIGSLGIVRDSTKRKNTEDELRATGQALLALIEASPLGIIVINTDGTVSLWNPALERIFGMTKKEIVNVPFNNNNKSTESRKLRDLVLQGKTVAGVEMRWKKADGTTVNFSVSSAPLTNEKGAIYAVMAIIEDITERKRLEKEILEISGREQRRIGQDIHDGLGQLLTGIAFKSSVLEQTLAEKGLEEARDAGRIENMVNNALEQASNLARALSPVALEAEGLMTALQKLCSQVENMFNIACTFYCNETIYVHNNIVATNLYRIAQEAVNNAVKHGEAERIKIKLHADDSHVTLWVADEGTGFCEKSDSMGMGLQIMRYRAGMIGAELDIQSKPGNGTIVKCSLDIHETPNTSEGTL